MQQILAIGDKLRDFNVTDKINIISCELTNGRLMHKFAPFIEKFLNTGSVSHEISGFNLDLQSACQILMAYSQGFIEKCRVFFRPEYNNLEVYNYYRFVFNEMKQEKLSSIRKQNYACLFIYLNLHGAKRFVRYNEQGCFNLEYGNHKVVFFPETELLKLVDNNLVAQAIKGEVELMEILYGNYSY